MIDNAYAQMPKSNGTPRDTSVAIGTVRPKGYKLEVWDGQVWIEFNKEQVRTKLVTDLWGDHVQSEAPHYTLDERGVPHQHVSKDGLLVDCYHGTKNLVTDWKFWLGMTFGWPLEHYLYSHVWPFSLVASLIGVG